jgi:hypothetical protein
MFKYLIFISLFTLSINSNAQVKKKKVITKSVPQSEETEKDGQKFCFDDTYGTTGMKLKLSLYEDKTAKLEFIQNDVVKRKGSGKWAEKSAAEQGYGDNSMIYLYLPNGTLRFIAMKNSWNKIYMLTDSKDNQYLECF